MMKMTTSKGTKTTEIKKNRKGGYLERRKVYTQRKPPAHLITTLAVTMTMTVIMKVNQKECYSWKSIQRMKNQMRKEKVDLEAKLVTAFKYLKRVRKENKILKE